MPLFVFMQLIELIGKEEKNLNWGNNMKSIKCILSLVLSLVMVFTVTSSSLAMASGDDFFISNGYTWRQKIIKWIQITNSELYLTVEN